MTTEWMAPCWGSCPVPGEWGVTQFSSKMSLFCIVTHLLVSNLLAILQGQFKGCRLQEAILDRLCLTSPVEHLQEVVSLVT